MSCAEVVRHAANHLLPVAMLSSATTTCSGHLVQQRTDHPDMLAADRTSPLRAAMPFRAAQDQLVVADQRSSLLDAMKDGDHFDLPIRH